MEACMNPTTIGDCRVPIAADEKETAAVVQLRDFMADKPADTRHASLCPPSGRSASINVVRGPCATAARGVPIPKRRHSMRVPARI